jgi:hypothetical protein
VEEAAGAAPEEPAVRKRSARLTKQKALEEPLRSPSPARPQEPETRSSDEGEPDARDRFLQSCVGKNFSD